MAYRYRQIYPQNGEVLNPQDWNLNHAELASEFNGYLDRDNLPDDSIGVSRVESRTFVVAHTDAHQAGGADVAIDDVSTQWISNDGTNYIGTLSFNCPVDCVLDIEFSCMFDGGLFFAVNDVHEYGIRFRANVDGAVVAQSGWLSFGYVKNFIYIVGATPVTAGKRVVTVERQMAIPDTSTGQNYSPNLLASGINPDITARELVVIERRR